MLSNRIRKGRALSTASPQSHVTAFQYRPLIQQSVPEEPAVEEVQEPKVCFSEEVFAQRLAEEHALGVAETEARLKRDFEQVLANERARVAESIRLFEQTRTEYFAKVEGEVVQLALFHRQKDSAPGSPSGSVAGLGIGPNCAHAN